MIQYSCDVLKQVQLEAWHVTNLQSFFYSCCSATLQSTEERDRQEREQRGHSRLEVKHPELYRTIADY